jgi:hypothetical protein
MIHIDQFLLLAAKIKPALVSLFITVHRHKSHLQKKYANKPVQSTHWAIMG